MSIDYMHACILALIKFPKLKLNCKNQKGTAPKASSALKQSAHAIFFKVYILTN